MLTLAQYFKQSGLPLSEARMLVAELLQVSRAWMITHDDYVLSQEQFTQIFRDVKAKGKLCSPRGLKVIELENYTYELVR